MLFEIYALLFTFGSLTASYLTFVPKDGGFHFWAWLLIVPLSYVCALLLLWAWLFLISLPYKEDNERMKCSKWAAWWFNHALAYVNMHARVKLKIKNKNSVPKNTRFLMVSNHRGRFDPMILAQVYGKYGLSFVSKPSNFKIPVGHRFMWAQCYMSIDRNDFLQSLSVMKRCQKLISENVSSVGIFPEGRRQTETILGDFHEGVFNIAIKTNAPIVVCTFDNTDKVASNFPWKSTKITLDIVRVIYPDEINGMTAKEVSDLVHQLMVESLEK